MICPFGNITCHDRYCAGAKMCKYECEDEDEEEEDDYRKPCPTCGDVNGSRNPCCPDYDPLHIDNCGYG